MTPLTVFFKTLSKTSALFIGTAFVFLHPPLEWTNGRAVTALKSPSQLAMDSLASALNDPDPNVRKEAAAALNGWRRASVRHLAQAGAVRDLVAQLSAGDAAARTKAACDLRKREDEAAPAIDALIGLLADDAPVERSVCGDRWRRGNIDIPTTPGEQAAAALASIGSRSLDPLLKATKHASGVARKNAAWALGALDDSRAVSALVAALKDSDAGVRKQAAWALGAIGDASSVPALVDALKDAGRGVREQAAWALGAIGDRRAVEGLMRLLGDSEAPVREQAAWALGAIGDNRAVDSLLPLLKDPNVEVRRQAAWAIGAIGK